jgi:hypothetical protein
MLTTYDYMVQVYSLWMLWLRLTTPIYFVALVSLVQAYLGPAMEAPSPELAVAFDELGEPEAEGGRLPRALLPGVQVVKPIFYFAKLRLHERFRGTCVAVNRKGD